MFSPLKTGIAVACLLGIAALIAKDQWNADRRSATVPIPGVEPSTPLHSISVDVACPMVSDRTALAVIIPKGPPGPPSEASKAGRAIPTESPAKWGTETSPLPADSNQSPATAPVRPPAQESHAYTVAQGDSLYGISVKLFGTPRHYERLYEANRDRIKDPNTLQVGVNLRIPDVAPRQDRAGAGGEGSPVPARGPVDSGGSRADLEGGSR